VGGLEQSKCLGFLPVRRDPGNAGRRAAASRSTDQQRSGYGKFPENVDSANKNVIKAWLIKAEMWQQQLGL
jgi:hypothetical protein